MHAAVQYSQKRMQELLKHESTSTSNEPVSLTTGTCVCMCTCYHVGTAEYGWRRVDED